VIALAITAAAIGVGAYLRARRMHAIALEVLVRPRAELDAGDVARALRGIR
jgi:hypothetical protein